MARRKEAGGARPSAYDSLIDAERDALIQAGRKPNRADLIRALIEASDLSPRAARRAVDSFIDRRGGFIPSRTGADDARTGWIDDLLDAERARAARDDRPVTRQTMIRAVRQASSSLAAREAQAAVDDYLYRRGGRTPRARRWWLATVGVVAVLIALAMAAWMRLRG